MTLAPRACMHTVLYTVYNERTGEIEKEEMNITEALDLLWYLNSYYKTDKWKYRFSISY